MSAYKISWILGGLTLFIGVTNAEEVTRSKGIKTTPMMSLQKLLGELLPDVVSEERFNDPKNRKRIELQTKRLRELSHAMPDPKPGSLLPSDLTLPLVASIFVDETERAYRYLLNGQRSAARDILQTIPGYCISCHSRMDSAPLRLENLDKALQQIRSPIDRANLLAATRQFDRAIEAYESVLDDPKSAENRQLDWERAARHSVTLAVRVKNDPTLTLKLIDRQLNSQVTPAFLKPVLNSWKSSATAWQKESKKTTTSDSGVVAEAKRIFSDAQKRQQYPADRSAQIEYLRVTGLVHRFLADYPNSSYRAEMLLLGGAAYEALRGLDLWHLHEAFYEACILQIASSPEVGQTCYERLEQSLYLGFSGSGGTSIPQDVHLRLQRLHSVAYPKDLKESPSNPK